MSEKKNEQGLRRKRRYFKIGRRLIFSTAIFFLGLSFMIRGGKGEGGGVREGKRVQER